MNAIYRLSKLPNYLRAFSPLEAIRLQLGNEFAIAPTAGKKMLRLRLTGYPNQIYVRRKGSDRSIFWQCLVTRQYDLKPFPVHNAAMQARYQSIVQSGDTPLIIDCGGNIGLAAIWFAKVFPKAKVISVEPDKANHEVLKKNIEHRDNITPILGAVWSRREEIYLEGGGRGGAGSSVTINRESEAITAYTIDDILQLEPDAIPFLIKIDIEGAQKNLFSENTDWVAKFPCVILELEDWLLPWQGTTSNFFTCVSKLPMDYLIRGENIFCFSHSLVDQRDTTISPSFSTT